MHQITVSYLATVERLPTPYAPQNIYTLVAKFLDGKAVKAFYDETKADLSLVVPFVKLKTLTQNALRVIIQQHRFALTLVP